MKSETPKIPSPWSTYLDEEVEESKLLIQSHSLGSLGISKNMIAQSRFPKLISKNCKSSFMRKCKRYLRIKGIKKWF